MPTKLKGMTSLEIAIIVAIVLIIAVAVGWYLYTTFVASTTGQPRLNVVSAEISNRTGKLNITVVNPGPVDVVITAVEVGGKMGTISTITDNKAAVLSQGLVTVSVGGQARIIVSVPGQWTPGTTLPGRVILSGGQSFPFNAVVRP
ncbi:class III signal peptide [Pyrobaculum aerophilum]|uniref:class III signal peptide n=1 Tax=Pyrobaculum aerophilum TaxID=13773 RepID=UPI002FDB6CE1